MLIQWFPGHMNKARKELLENLPQVDVVIEMLDARIPFSSENPMLQQIRGDKPCIKVLNKSDLADPELTARWQIHFEKQQNIKTLATSTTHPSTIKQLTSLCRSLVEQPKESYKPIHAMIMGIPNVGKSTIINVLSGRTIAKTGNEPAVTKMQQRIKLDNGILLIDTPGILWPNLDNKNSGFRLAATGAIKDTVVNYPDVAMVTLEYLCVHYSDNIAKRYAIDSMPATELELMDLIGKKRGCLKSGGIVDYDKVAKIILHEYRDGLLGRITLETPEMMEAELTELVIIREEKAAKKKAKEEKKKNRRRR